MTQEYATMENYEKNKHHLTRENAEKAWEGAKWADKKADEYGIDKYAVAAGVGNAFLSAGKFAYDNADKQTTVEDGKVKTRIGWGDYPGKNENQPTGTGVGFRVGGGY